MMAAQETLPHRQGNRTISLAESLLLGIVFSILSFDLLPDTPFAQWSLLAPFTSLLSREDITNYQPAIYALLTLAVIFWFRVPSGADVPRRAGLLWGFTGVYITLFAILAIQTSLNRYEVYNGGAVVLLALLTGLACAKLCGSAANILKMAAVIAVMQGTISLYDLHMGINVLWSGNVARAGGTFNQPILLYIPLIFILPYVLLQIIRSSSPIALGIGCCCFAILISALILTGMRGGMFAALVSTVFVVHAAYKQWKFSLVTFVIVGLLFVGVGYWRSHDAVDAASSARSNNGRLQVWKRAALILAHNPLTGIGLGATAIPLKVHSAAYPKRTALSIAIEPKNILLHWGDELGIGGLLLLGGFGYAIVKALHGCKDDVAISLGGAWLAIFAAGMTDTPFGPVDRTCGNVLIGLLLGATLLYGAQNSEAADLPALSAPQNEAAHA